MRIHHFLVEMDILLFNCDKGMIGKNREDTLENSDPV